MSLETAKLGQMANAIRALSMDAVQAANSGHPGMPMGMADVATVLFSQVLKFDPAAPKWPDRDRFVLSAGHGSMLIYSLLHLTGYAEPTMDDIRNFRQLHSKCAGHPENFELEGVECTTGPLGADEVAAAREYLGWTAAPFEVPADILADWRSVGAKGAATRALWHSRLTAAPRGAEFMARINGDLPPMAETEKALVLWAEGSNKVATRKASEMVLQTLTVDAPAMIGGSADLTRATRTDAKTSIYASARRLGDR